MQLHIQKVEQNNKVFTLYYTSEQPLPFDPHDVVMVSAGDYVVASVRELTADHIQLYISTDEPLEWGDQVVIQLAFSPTVSIVGSKDIIAKLGHFPDFEHGIITDHHIGKDQVELDVQLAEPFADHTIKLTFLEATEIEFSAPDVEKNEIAEMDFRYDETLMVVDIEAAQGMSGSFFCGGIKAEFKS